MQIDQNKYKVWKLPNLMLIHWILNPGLAVNELIFGQRVPKVTLVDKTSSAPLLERQFIPCPTCGEINDARLWAKGNALGHWFGLWCPKCENKIPCLWNLTSLLVLALTFPIWLPIKMLFEEKWKQRELTKLRTVVDGPLITAKKTSWIRMGFTYGVLMFCFMSLPRLRAGGFDPRQVAMQAAIWVLGGLMFGVGMWFFLGRKK